MHLSAPPRSRRCAVLGSPIEHSLSPVLHRAAYAELGLADWSYDRYEVREAELADFVGELDDSWRGLSLTMPLKVAALGLGQPDELVALVGAANTLILGPDGNRLYNTDVDGLVSAVVGAGSGGLDRVTVLGAGATARSSLVSAARLGATTVSVVARTPAKAEDLRPLAERLRLRLKVLDWSAPLEPTDLVISTVTAGAADARAEEIAACAAVVFDAIYDPWPTPLAMAGLKLGRAVLNGLDLLVGQAVLQVELMTGHQVAPGVLMAAGRAALSQVSPPSKAPQAESAPPPL
jgi:shikimate dehydrogenase